MISDEIEVEFDYDIEAEDNPIELKKTREDLNQRCKTNNFPISENKGLMNHSYLSIGLPCGRNRHWVDLWDLDARLKFLSIEFRKIYIFRGLYGDMLISGKHYRAFIQPLGHFLVFPHNFFERLLGLGKNPDDTRLILNLSEENVDVKIILGSVSNELAALSGRNIRSRFSLRMEGIQVNQHDQALDLLERVSNSLFFQIDLSRNLPLSSGTPEAPKNFFK